MKHRIISILLCIALFVGASHASLNITGDGTDNIAVTNVADIQDENAWTMIWWWRWATSFNDFGRLAGKGTGAANEISVAFSANLANGLDVKQNTDNTDLSQRIGSLSIDTDDTWQYLAVTMNLANGAGDVVDIYYGNLTTVVTLDGTDGTADGNSNEGAATLYVGNNRNLSNFGLGGDVAMFQYWNKEMSLGEIRKQQYHPHFDANCQIFFFPGFQGATTVADFSGNGNTGTGTGTTIANPVPLGPPFGFSNSTDWVLPWVWAQQGMNKYGFLQRALMLRM